MSQPQEKAAASTVPKQGQADDEVDPWDKRIDDTGCSAENMKLTDCFYEKKDWRKCTAEMAAFRACWDKKGNSSRVATRDAEPSSLEANH